MSESPPTEEEYVVSPCIGVCSIDPATKMCIGCLRTLKEIGAWRSMSPAQKKAVVEACNARAANQPRRLADGSIIADDHPKLARFRKTD